MYHQQRNHCTNGPGCYFFKQNNCHFYHPPSSMIKSRSSISWRNFTLNQDSQKSQKQLQKKRQAEFEKQRQQQIRRQRQQMRERQRNRELQFQRIQQRIERQTELRLYRLFQRLSSSGWNRSSLTFINKQQQQFSWFFQRNKIFNLMQNKSSELQKFSRCPICCQDFLEQIKSKRQQILQKNEPEQKQKNKQLYGSWFQYLKENQQSQESELNKQILLIELYCGHIYHKDCVQNWLKKNPKCAVCRKDFRDHQRYQTYKQRFKSIQQEKRQQQMLIEQILDININDQDQGQSASQSNQLQNNLLEEYSFPSLLNQQQLICQGQIINQDENNSFDLYWERIRQMRNQNQDYQFDQYQDNCQPYQEQQANQQDWLQYRKVFRR